MPVLSSFRNFDWSEIALFSGDFADFQHWEDVINTILCVVCVISAGLAAGLTMGLLSLDVTKLEIKAMTGSTVDRADAEAILPIVKKHHLLLVTLLLFNSMANEALPVFLSALLPEWLSVLISVTLVLVFGEILPSAFFTGKAQLHTAAIMIPFVKTLTFFFWPIGFPLSRCLDYAFGVEEETSVITREELGALVVLQNNSRHRKKDSTDAQESTKTLKMASQKSSSNIKHSQSVDSFVSESTVEDEGGLSTYEINIMTGILKLSKLQVKDSMIKIKRVYMISDSTRLDRGTLERLWNCGFSRVPVFKRRDKQHIIGYLLIKSLILVSADDRVPVETLPIRQPLFVKPGLHLLEMLSMFREGRCHMALVTEDPISAMKCMSEGRRARANIIGIVTLEDVIEEIIQGEITDETDEMPSVFPVGGRTRPGGTSAMGIHSMGRSSIMQKSAASRFIRMEEDDSKIVKRSVRYANNSGAPDCAFHNKVNSSLPSENETATRRNWHQRSTIPSARNPEGASSAYARPMIRHRDPGSKIYGTKEQSDYSYGAVDLDDDAVDESPLSETHLTQTLDSPSTHRALPSSASASIPSAANCCSVTSTCSGSGSTGSRVSAPRRVAMDSYMRGELGYRITSHLDIDYASEEQIKYSENAGEIR